MIKYFQIESKNLIEVFKYKEIVILLINVEEIDPIIIILDIDEFNKKIEYKQIIEKNFFTDFCLNEDKVCKIKENLIFKNENRTFELNKKEEVFIDFTIKEKATKLIDGFINELKKYV